MFTATNWGIDQTGPVSAVVDSMGHGDQHFMLRSSIGGWGTGCEQFTTFLPAPLSCIAH